MSGAAHRVEDRVNPTKKFDLFVRQQTGVAYLINNGHRIIERQRDLIGNKHKCWQYLPLNVKVSGKQLNRFNEAVQMFVRERHAIQRADRSLYAIWNVISPVR
jgi:hypothetical protein